MSQRHILVVVVDGLRASVLGAYGNTTYLTPAFDQFAADSLLLDSCFAAAPELDSIYDSLWRSAHPAARVKAAAAPSLPDMLRDADYETVLVTDAREVLSLREAERFSRRVEVAEATTAERANTIGETALGRLFAAAAEEVALSQDSRQKLIWVHSRGMYGPWDAPLEFQSDLFDEDDPPPVESIEPPDFQVSQNGDPDSVFRFGSAYAGQVMALDECFSALIDSIPNVGDEWMVMLLGAKGYSLGEHGRIGGVDSRLYAEQLHVPWLLRLPGGEGRLMRASQLVLHVDLLPTIADFIQAPLANSRQGASVLPLAAAARTTWRDELVSVSRSGDVAIRTPDWCWRQKAAPSDRSTAGDSAAEGGELFVRPDDRWEANDVAKLCPDDVELLAKRAKELIQSLG